MAGGKKEYSLGFIIGAQVRSSFPAAFKKVEKQLAATQKAVQNAGAAWKTFGSNVGKLAIGAAGAAAAGIAAVYRMTNDIADTGDRAWKNAAKLKMTTEAYQELEYAFGKAGLGGEEFASMMETLDANILNAAKDGKKASAWADEFNISAEKLAGMSPEKRIERLADYLNHLEDPLEKDRLAMELFGKSGAEMESLLSMGSEGIRQLRDEAVRTNSVMSDEAAEQAHAYINMKKELTKSVDGIKVQLFGGLLGSFTEVFGDIAKRLQGVNWADWGKKIAGWVRDAVPMFKAIAQAVGDFIGKIWSGAQKVKEFVGGWGNLAKIVAGIVAFKTVLSGLVAVITTVIAVKKAWGIVQGALSASTMANPVMLTIAAVAALVVGIILLIKNWDKVKEVAKKVWGAVTKSISGAWDTVKQKWGQITAFFSRLWNGVKSAASTVWNKVSGFVSGAWDTAKAKWSGITGFFAGKWNGIKTAAATKWGEVSGAITGAWESAKAKWNGVTAFFSGKWNGIKSAASAKWTEVSESIGNAWTLAKAKWGAVKTFFSEKWSGITSAASSKWSEVSDTIGNAWTSAKTKWGSVKTFFSEKWNGIQTAASTKWGEVSDKVTGVWDTITEKWNETTEFFSGIWNQVVVRVGAAWSTVSGLVTGAWLKIKAIWDTVVDFFSGIWTSIQTSVQTFVDNVKDKFKPITDIFDSIKETLGNLFGGTHTMNVDANLRTSADIVNDWDSMMADGGIVTRPTRALIGEGGDTEVVVPINNKPRSRSLWETAGRMAGFSQGGGAGNGSVAVSVPVSVTVQGNADAETVRQINGAAQNIEARVEAAVRRALENQARQNARTSFA